MNRQELIKKYKELEKGSFDIGALVVCQLIIKDLEQLDEPEKVKIPQFVADWIKHSKTIGRSLFGAMSIFEENTEIKKWMQWADNQETFARAWLDGYEVEKEKRYFVKMKGVFKGYEFLTFKFGRVWIFSNEEENEEFRTAHTSKELEEAGFGWVFDCEGVEIEEVTE